jgi:polyhydroxybutyrate depolymerase
MTLLLATLAVAAAFPVGQTNNTISSSGSNRRFLMYVPQNVTLPAPVMFAFHGFNNDEECTMNNFGLRQLADLNKFIAVTPRGSGLPLQWNAGDCCGLSNSNDVQFFRDMVAKLRTMGSVDMNRIYSGGYSNGGYMSYRLACEASDLLAGIYPVAGALSKETTFSCQRQVKPIPAVHFHGTSDTVIRYSEALDSFSRYPKVAAMNCQGSPAETFRQGTASCQAYQACNGNGKVELCSFQGMPHAWPGAGQYCNSNSCGCGGPDDTINAVQHAWNFFRNL